MGAMLCNFTTFQDSNFVRHAHCAKTVGNEDTRASGNQFSKMTVHFIFGLRIESGRWFIQNK